MYYNFRTEATVLYDKNFWGTRRSPNSLSPHQPSLGDPSMKESRVARCKRYDDLTERADAAAKAAGYVYFNWNCKTDYDKVRYLLLSLTQYYSSHLNSSDYMTDLVNMMMTLTTSVMMVKKMKQTCRCYDLLPRKISSMFHFYVKPQKTLWTLRFLSQYHGISLCG